MNQALSLILLVGLIFGPARPAFAASLPERGLNDSKFTEGESLFRGGHFEEAFPYYESVKKRYPGDRAELISRLRIGKIQLHRKNYEAARTELLEAAKRFPKSEQNDVILLGVATAELGLKHYAASRKALSKVSSRSLEVVSLAFKIAIAQQDRSAALRTLDEMAELPETKQNEAVLSRTLEKAKLLIKSFKSRPELEQLHEVVANNDIKNWIEMRLGRSGARDPASSQNRTAAGYRDRNWRRPSLTLTPGVGLFSAEAADRTTGSSALFVSNPVPNLNLNLDVPAATIFDIFATVDVGLISLKAPSSRTLNNASQIDFEFGGGPKLYFSGARRVSVSLWLGAGQEILSRATSATEITIERVFIPKLSFIAMVELLQSPSFSLFTGGGAGYLFGTQSTSVSISSGQTFFGRATGKFTLSPSSDFRAGVFLSNVRLTTSFEIRQNILLALETGFSFRL